MGRYSDFSNEEVAYLEYDKKILERDKATLYHLTDVGSDQWVPKSLIQCDNEGILGVPTRWARKSGLI